MSNFATLSDSQELRDLAGIEFPQIKWSRFDNNNQDDDDDDDDTGHYFSAILPPHAIDSRPNTSLDQSYLTTGRGDSVRWERNQMLESQQSVVVRVKDGIQILLSVRAYMQITWQPSS